MAVTDRIVVDVNRTTGRLVVGRAVGQSKVVEVLRGAPGLQNVFIGIAPPQQPQENWIWVDIS